MKLIISILALYMVGAHAVVQEQMFKGTAKLVEVLIPNELLSQKTLKFSCRRGSKEAKTYPYITKENRLFALIAETYYSEFETISCHINETKVAEILVLDKAYPITYLRVPSEQTSPSPETQARIEREQTLLGKVYATSSSTLLYDKPFVVPLDSVVTSPYGVKRIYNNGELAGYHSGIDYRAATGTSLYSANSGKVILAQDLFVTGNTVIIDHGKRLFTIYAHMSKISVTVGQIVKQKQLIGLAGATGRVTGPHLHWGVRLHSTLVDGNTIVSETETFFDRF
ncbi:MAG: M23 family metallopeptidase [Bacteriovoracaceae bacterium]|nr:M23 family metallopeptidase [Bacteriovoracaceae bacterium]